MRKNSVGFTNIVIAICTLFLAFPAAASEISIRPFLLDETLSPRDVSQQLVTINSEYETRKAVLYATVNEISVDAEGEIKDFTSPIMTDRTNTITSWIEVTRGRIEIPAGETREIPLTIRVHPYAEPGTYHAFIGFVEAPNRPAAESIAKEGDAKGVILKVIISDNRDDIMHLSGFTIDRFITGEDDRRVSIAIENTGDITSAPTGEVILYDSRGVEVGYFNVNEEGQTVSPGETLTLEEEIPLHEKLGRYKAKLALKYGENQSASLQDSTNFYLVPMKYLVPIFVAVLLVAIFTALLFRRAFLLQDDEDECDEVAMYVKDGHDAKPQDHDIDLKNQN